MPPGHATGDPPNVRRVRVSCIGRACVRTCARVRARARACACARAPLRMFSMRLYPQALEKSDAGTDQSCSKEDYLCLV